MHPFEEALREFVGKWQDKGTSHGTILDAMEMVAMSVQEESDAEEGRQE